MSEPPAQREHPVTPLELFFDLVFVFGFTQVTTLMTDDPTWSGLGEGLMVLAAIWSVWAAYAWLTNVVDPEEGAARGAMLVAIGAAVIAALAVPDVFGEHGVLFGVAFLVVRVMHVVLYALASRGDSDLLAAVLRITPTTLAAAGLIIAAGFADDKLRIALWLAALVIDYVGIRVRLTHSLSLGRSVATGAFLLLWPVAVAVPALAALALAALIWVLLHAYEFVWWREARAETRALRLTANS